MTYRGALWAVLVVAVGVWAHYAGFMRQYPLMLAYPIEQLAAQLRWLAIVFAALYGAVAVLIVRPHAWSRMMFVVVALVAFIALTMAPIRSPDLYWTLDAGKAWVQDGLNPYHAGVRVPMEGAWSARAGLVMGMPYGPLWVYLVGMAAAAGSLVPAIIVMKCVGAAAFAAGVVAVWKLMAAYGVSAERREPLFALLLLNPLLLQAGLVDVSPDIITFAAIAWAMLLSARGRYVPAAAVLTLGGLVKYVPWILIPIPLAQAWLSQIKPRTSDVLIGLGAVAVALAAYVPFGSEALLGSDMRLAFSVFVREDMAFPVAWLLLKLGMPVFWIQLTGGCAAVAVAAYCIVRRQWFAAWWAPLAALLLVGGSWVNPWYLLWLLPAAASAGSAAAIAAIGVSGILMPWAVRSRDMGFALLAAAAVAYGFRHKIKTAL